MRGSAPCQCLREASGFHHRDSLSSTVSPSAFPPHELLRRATLQPRLVCQTVWPLSNLAAMGPMASFRSLCHRRTHSFLGFLDFWVVHVGHDLHH